MPPITDGDGVGAGRLFFEIFQETSSGDFGIETKNGVLFRCHTHILETTPGFLLKVRETGTQMPLTVDDAKLTLPSEFFRKNKLTRLLPDVEFAQFSRQQHLSVIGGGGSKKVDPFAPGMTTANAISGSLGAVTRRNPFRLGERYQVDCDVEKIVEILRFVYLGYTGLFDLRPKEKEKDVYVQKMVDMFFLSDKFAVDMLFDQLLTWFRFKCRKACGDHNFADTWYQMEHFVNHQCQEKLFRDQLRQTLLEMLADRHHFRLVTRDSRWTSLKMDLAMDILSYDELAIGSETEILNLVERWNANADKKKEDIITLLSNFRPDPESRKVLRMWFANMGLNPEEDSANMSETSSDDPLLTLWKGTSSKKPRNNLEGKDLEGFKAELQQAEAEAQKAASEAAAAAAQEEKETQFVQYDQGTRVNSGFSFNLRQQQLVIQRMPFRKAGTYRMRTTLTQNRSPLWITQHEVFVGVTYGQNRYFGYICGLSAYSGIFSVQTFASVSPGPNAPVHLTGSGNKMEFDIELDIEMQRINKIVCCKLSIILNNTTLTEDPFQVTYQTLKHGDGLRYQVVGAGLGEGEVDVQLAWVGGGSVEQDPARPSEA